MRYGDFVEAEPPRALRRRALVLRMGPPVQQHDGHRAQSRAPRACQFRLESRGVERSQNHAMRIDALVRLDHRRVQRRGRRDFEREDVGTILIPDAQRVGEARRGDERHGLPAAREQRIGRDGGADLHRREPPGPAPRALENPADRGELAGLAGRAPARPRWHLAHVQLALGRESDDIRERAAPVDPELPGRIRRCLTRGRLA